MPFVDKTGAHPKPSLQIVSADEFRLTTPFDFVTADRRAIHVHARRRTTTDLASVPKLLWGLMASYGHQTLPALLHDQLCHQAEPIADEPMEARRAKYRQRRAADDLFREALRDEGVEFFRRWTFWTGVVFGRYWTFRRTGSVLLGVLVLLLTASIYYGLASLVASCFGVDIGPAWWILLGAPVAVSLLVRYEGLWRLLLVGAYVGLPVALLTTVSFLVQVWTRLLPWAVLCVLRWVLTALHLPAPPPPGPPPPVGPTNVRLII